MFREVMFRSNDIFHKSYEMDQVESRLYRILISGIRIHKGYAWHCIIREAEQKELKINQYFLLSLRWMMSWRWKVLDARATVVAGYKVSMIFKNSLKYFFKYSFLVESGGIRVKARYIRDEWGEPGKKG